MIRQVGTYDDGAGRLRPVFGFTFTGLAVLSVVITIAIASAFAGLATFNKATSTQTATCTIQNRGLSATPHLTKIIGDIGQVLTPQPRVKAQPVPPGLVAPLANLREEAGAYVAIEKQQPSGRKC